MEEILSGLINASSGGIFGGLFGGVMAIAGGYIKGREKNNQHNRDMELARFQLEADSKSHNRDMEASKASAGWQAFQASVEDGQSSNSSAAASLIKAIFRPFLTTILVAASVLIFYVLSGALRGEPSVIAGIFTAEEISAMLRNTVNTLQFSASASVTWWFGERGMMAANAK